MAVIVIDPLVHHSTIFEFNVECYRRRKAGDKQNAQTPAVLLDVL
ncbi:hypothetical protein [Caballeronia sp. SL2Y3]|nr:hypothetical protein [Caballeronia sp. SL2Y3]